MSIADILGGLRALAVISTQLTALKYGQEKQNMDISKLVTVVGRLATDFTALDTDMRAYLAANPPSDPAQQAQADALAAKLDGVADGLESLDAATKATPPIPSSGGTTPQP